MAQAEQVVPVTTERDETRRVSVEWPVYGAIILALVVAALLGSARLVDLAQRQPYGPNRDRLVSLATGLHSVAQAVGFDRPMTWVDMALGRGHYSADLGLAQAPPPVVLAAPLGTPAVIAATAPTVVAATPAPAASPTPGVTAVPPSPTARPPNATPIAVAPTSVAPASATATAPAPTTAPEAPPNPVQTAGREPIRALVIGDSNAEWVGYDLAAYGLRDGALSSKLDFRLSSGLAVPEFFNWPGRLQQQMAVEPPPEAVVVFLGGNDTQNLRTPSGVVMTRSPEWIEEYSRRVGQMMDIAGARGARVYWIGMPVMRDEARSALVSDMNQAAQNAVAERENARFIDIWELFSDEQGGFATYLPDYRGEMTAVRQNDGVHLTRVGTTWISLIVYDQILKDFGMRK